MLEFVTKTPKAQKTTGFFSNTLKVNTSNGNINLSTSVVVALKGDSSPEEDLMVGMAFDGEKKEAFIFRADDGLKASGRKQSTVRSTYLVNKIVETCGVEDQVGKVLVMNVDLDSPVNHETEDGSVIVLYKAEYKESIEPRGGKKSASSEKEEAPQTNEEPVQTAEAIPQQGSEPEEVPWEEESGPAPGITAAPQSAPTIPSETTTAEEEGLQSKDVADVVGNIPPSAPAPGAMEWPSDN